MNLIQKLCEPFDGLRTETAKELEKITDDFAIGFAEWCVLWRIQFADNKRNLYYYGGVKTKEYTIQELLEIYKKEKEL